MTWTFLKRIIFLFSVLIILKPGNAVAQSTFCLQAQASPKISVNSNSGIIVGGRYNSGSNEPDGRSALAFGLGDYSFSAGYSLNRSNRFSIGAGVFTVNQIFRPSYVNFGGKYRNIRQQLKFLTIPLSYERLLYSGKKINLYAGLHLSLIGDVFRNDLNRNGFLKFKNGTTDPTHEWNYSVHYLNMRTFNLLYGFSVKCAYALTKRTGISGATQMMQGFRPLITSVVTITDNNNNIYNPSLSTTNGQSILLNLGVYYYL